MPNIDQIALSLFAPPVPGRFRQLDCDYESPGIRDLILEVMRQNPTTNWLNGTDSSAAFYRYFDSLLLVDPKMNWDLIGLLAMEASDGQFIAYRTKLVHDFLDELGLSTEWLDDGIAR